MKCSISRTIPAHKGENVKVENHSEEDRGEWNNWGELHLLRKIHIVFLVVANDKMVQPLSFPKNPTKGTASVVSRQPSVLVISVVRGSLPEACPCPCT